jgi:hypothetical protein
MRAAKRGIARVAIAVAVIVIVVVAGVAGYALLAQGPTASKSTSTSSASTTSAATSNSSSTGTNSITSSSAATSTTSTTTSSTVSSTTTSTTSTTSTTQTSSSTTSSNTCAANETSTEPPTIADFATLLGNFSRLSMTLATSAASGASHPESSYQVVYASRSGNLTTYKVEINDNASGTSSLTEAWITSAGTVIAVNSGGANETGAQADSALSSSAGPFLSLIMQGQLLGVYTSSPQVRPVNQTGVMLGPTLLYITNFAAMTFPAVATSCQAAFTLTTFSLQATPVYGTDLILVTHEHIEGTETSVSGTSPVYVLMQILSVTAA